MNPPKQQKYYILHSRICLHSSLLNYELPQKHINTIVLGLQQSMSILNETIKLKNKTISHAHNLLKDTTLN